LLYIQLHCTRRRNIPVPEALKSRTEKCGVDLDKERTKPKIEPRQEITPMHQEFCECKKSVETNKGGGLQGLLVVVDNSCLRLSLSY
jgi:hypothetical protein